MLILMIIPVSPITTGQPVKNPVDAAVEAVRAAWEQPGLRQELLDALTHVESFNDLSRERMAVATQSAIAQQLFVHGRVLRRGYGQLTQRTFSTAPHQNKENSLFFGTGSFCVRNKCR